MATPLSIGNNDQDTTYSGVLSDGSLTKIGAGTLTLGGVNTYGGATDVQSGTLLVGGSHTGGAMYTVGTEATLGGAGSIDAPVTLAGGMSPGASVGSFGSGTETWQDGGSFLFEIDDAEGYRRVDSRMGPAANHRQPRTRGPQRRRVRDRHCLAADRRRNQPPATRPTSWPGPTPPTSGNSFKPPTGSTISTPGCSCSTPAGSAMPRRTASAPGRLPSSKSATNLAITFNGAVPEPSSLVLALLSLLLGLGLAGRRRRHRART